MNSVSYFRERIPIAVSEPTEFRHPRRRLLRAAERMELVRHIATLSTDPAPPATAAP
jgi:hypothetical protein